MSWNNLLQEQDTEDRGAALLRTSDSHSRVSGLHLSPYFSLFPTLFSLSLKRLELQWISLTSVLNISYSLIWSENIVPSASAKLVSGHVSTFSGLWAERIAVCL